MENTQQKEPTITIEPFEASGWAASLKSTIDTAATEIRTRMLIARIMQSGDKPPTNLMIQVNGGRIDIHPEAKISEKEFNPLLAWFVRKTGKRFNRRYLDGCGVYWSTNYVDFQDELGKFNGRIDLNGAPLGNCRVVEEKVTRIEKRIVCGDGEK